MPLTPGPKLDVDIIARFTPTGAEQVIAAGIPIPIRAHSDLDNKRVVLSLDTDPLTEAIGDAVIGDPDPNRDERVDAILDRYIDGDSAYADMVDHLISDIEDDLRSDGWDDDELRGAEARQRLALAFLTVDIGGGHGAPIPALFSQSFLRERMLKLALEILYVTG